MNNIDKLNNKQVLDYLVKVSKVQNKLLKKPPMLEILLGESYLIV